MRDQIQALLKKVCEALAMRVLKDETAEALSDLKSTLEDALASDLDGL